MKKNKLIKRLTWANSKNTSWKRIHLSFSSATTEQHAKPVTGIMVHCGSGKVSLHEGGIRVPFIMKWKGTVPAGVVESRPVIQLDATATAVDLAGGDISDMNGVNLMPYLLKQKDGVPHKQLSREKLVVASGSLV